MTFIFKSLQPTSEEHANSNLTVLLQWSPFSTEEELLKQCESVRHRGTKIIIYNLWLDVEGKMELDFESDLEYLKFVLILVANLEITPPSPSSNDGGGSVTTTGTAPYVD
ncbi:hypothetical protein Tco_1293153 [Tanacetum coccineum]